jgi:hypothetical protein
MCVCRQVHLSNFVCVCKNAGYMHEQACPDTARIYLCKQPHTRTRILGFAHSCSSHQSSTGVTPLLLYTIVLSVFKVQTKILIHWGFGRHFC